MTDRIRRFADIPDVITMDIPPMEHIVPALGIARNTIVLWTGADGDGKTFLVQALAVAVARGADFLSMPCQKTPVLYVDHENPAYMVQSRLRPMVGEEQIEELRFWGIWCDQQPPQMGSESLLTIAKETRPLIIVDPFRYFHSAEENDSTTMSAVMQYLRACAAYGAAVILLHHPSKAEGSTGRGSSAIRGACDLAFLHSLDKDSGLITLKVDKNRHGESRTISIRADFENGSFDMTESPYITRRKDELAKIEDIIKAQPGIGFNAIFKKASGIQRNRLQRLLSEGCGTQWHIVPGPNRSKLYYPGKVVQVVLSDTNASDTTVSASESVNRVLGGTAVESEGAVVPVVRRSIGGTTVSPTDHGQTLPSCPNCGSFALYRDGSCMTCENAPAP